MLLTRQGYRRRYAYGGRGLFDTVKSLLGRVFTSAAAKTLGRKAATTAANAAFKGVEKGATKAVDHLVSKIPSKPKLPAQARSNSSKPKLPAQARAILIDGSGIATVHNFARPLDKWLN